MFRKPFKIRSNNTLRGSERRKLRENVSKSYPMLTTEALSQLIPNKEEMSVMKIFTHNEEILTCYCLKKNPIFFQINTLLLPTVYLLWSYPCNILSFQTFPNVLAILAGGADLMFPGVIPPKEGLPHFNVNQPCFVTLLGNSSAVAVGVTASSKQDIINDGAQGKRVTIYHCYQDHLWLLGDRTEVPLMLDITMLLKSTDNVEHADVVIVDDVDKSIKNIVELPDADRNPANEDKSYTTDGENPTNETEIIEELSPQEMMDKLLLNCFCQAVLDAKKVELPILVSKFSSRYLHPTCPEGQRIDVKKSSYRKMSKFLADMQVKGLIEVKELSKGVESITKLYLENEILKEYKKSEFAQLRKEFQELKLLEEQDAAKKNDKGVEIRDLFSVSAKTVTFFKEFELSKGAVLSASEVRKYVTEYVKKQQLTDPANKMYVRLDPLLTDTLYERGNYEERLPWDALLTKLTGAMNICHEVTIPGHDPIIKKGRMDFIEVSIEQRMGNKKVTIIKNLESFGIDTKRFAQELQQTAASSTSVNPVPGKNITSELVLVQGVQTNHIQKMLDAHKIPRKYIKGLDGKDLKKKKR